MWSELGVHTVTPSGVNPALVIWSMSRCARLPRAPSVRTSWPAWRSHGHAQIRSRGLFECELRTITDADVREAVQVAYHLLAAVEEAVLRAGSGAPPELSR
jgi:hypothetical protein